ncbi:splicing factor 3A subunit 3-like [Dysidea avara]|uniref:splicing factor 3A subunit 3-like n=1 Tax=Dysidea avara TaxID=196820 RepID=UPI00331FEF23
MDNVLEQQRKLHEERERLEDAIAKESLLKKATLRDQINSDHRSYMLLERSVESAQKLLDLYEDRDGMRSEEIQTLSGVDEFGEFYRRLKQLKDYHRKFADDLEEPMSMEFSKMDEMRNNPGEETQDLVDFSDEEGYGKFLDLHHIYTKYCNLKQFQKVDYLTYLSTFDRVFEIPREKKNQDYKKYLEALVDYFLDYLSRSKPLLDQSKLLSEIRLQFDEKWLQGQFPGWRKDTSSAMIHSGAHLDLSAFSSSEELMSLGLDRLKSALMALGLKCGGTLEQRAKRLFSTKGKPLDTLDSSMFVKSKMNKNRDEDERNEDVAFLEAQVYRLSEILSDQKQATKENIERKMARTAEELEEEEDIEEVIASDSDDDDSAPYNPKNLPLGWDGKPIPYWLYKLHGLNIEYRCEICGGHTYRGPKAFQQHFSEWRHAHGMRCLGIPNTSHFYNVTTINDAIALWEKIKSTKNDDRWLADREEEYEDTVGNVVNKKTYEDLRRQGLL